MERERTAPASSGWEAHPLHQRAEARVGSKRVEPWNRTKPPQEPVATLELLFHDVERAIKLAQPDIDP